MQGEARLGTASPGLAMHGLVWQGAAMEIVVRKASARVVGQIGLFAVTEMDSELLAALIPNEDIFITPRQHRNPRQHRLAWALAQKVSEACEWLGDREDAMTFLKIKSRHVKYIKQPDGNVLIVPKSIAFAAMTQAAFSRLLSRMIWVVCSEIVPGLKEKDLRNEIEAMVKGQ